MRKKAYAYLRVGSLNQTMSCTCLDDQKRIIKEYCRKNDIQLLGVYKDYPKSAGNLKRSGLKSLFGQIVVSPADYILVTELDRLTRSMSDHHLLSERLSKLGTEIKTAKENSPSNSLMLDMFESMRCFELAMERAHRNHSNG